MRQTIPTSSPKRISPTSGLSKGSSSSTTPTSGLSKGRSSSTTPTSGLSKGRSSSTTPTSGDHSRHSFHSVSTTSTDEMLCEILKEIKTSNKKVQELEKKVCDLEEGPSTKKRKTLKPSRETRDMVRKVYRALMEADENFEWNIQEPFSSTTNQDVMKQIVSDAKAHLPDVTSAMLREATPMYFHSMCETERLKDKGKYDEKCLKQRRRNRVMRN